MLNNNAVRDVAASASVCIDLYPTMQPTENGPVSAVSLSVCSVDVYSFTYGMAIGKSTEIIKLLLSMKGIFINSVVSLLTSTYPHTTDFQIEDLCDKMFRIVVDQVPADGCDICYRRLYMGDILLVAVSVEECDKHADVSKQLDNRLGELRSNTVEIVKGLRDTLQGAVLVPPEKKILLC